MRRRILILPNPSGRLQNSRRGFDDTIWKHTWLIKFLPENGVRKPLPI